MTVVKILSWVPIVGILSHTCKSVFKLNKNLILLDKSGKDV